MEQKKKDLMLPPLLTLKFGFLLKPAKTMLETDSFHQPYIHEQTEPVEVDQPELLDPKYGLQN